MRRVVVVLIVLFAFDAGAATAQEPAACGGPAIEALVVEPDALSGRPDPFRFGVPEAITFETSRATRLTVDWPDRTRTIAPVDGDRTTLVHTFGTAGRKRIVAAASNACGDSPPGAWTIDVHPPCELARDASVQATDCDDERGFLELAQAGVETDATWLSAGCNDVLFPEERIPPQPVARAACVASAGPPPVAGRLPVREGRAVILRLGAPAQRVLVALGTRSRRTTRYARAGAVGRGRRVFHVRVGRVVASTRLWVLVRRAGGADAYVAGLRATQSS